MPNSDDSNFAYIAVGFWSWPQAAEEKAPHLRNTLLNGMQRTFGYNESTESPSRAVHVHAGHLYPTCPRSPVISCKVGWWHTIPANSIRPQTTWPLRRSLSYNNGRAVTRWQRQLPPIQPTAADAISWRLPAQ